MFNDVHFCPAASICMSRLRNLTARRLARTTIWRHPTTILSSKDRRSNVGRTVLRMIVSRLGLSGARMARAEPNITKHSVPTADFLAGLNVSPDKSGISCVQDRNLVLVVDDDSGILEGLERLLRAHAYVPILFSSAEAFKNHTDFEKAACVILDINLNDGSGIELRHRLKAAGIRVRVIYMTGNEDPAIRKAALDSGCIAFLTKPFSMQDLMEPLQRVGNSGDTHE